MQLQKVHYRALKAGDLITEITYATSKIFPNVYYGEDSFFIIISVDYPHTNGNSCCILALVYCAVNQKLDLCSNFTVFESDVITKFST